MKDFKQRFREATGLTYDVEKLLNGASNENKLKLFKKLSWMIGKGAKVENPETDEAKEYALVMTEICDTIQLPKEIRETLPEMVFVNEIINANQDLGTIVNTYDELIAAVLVDGIISLGADIILKESHINVKGEVILNLNGHTITAKNRPTPSGESSNVFVVHPTGVLTINGNGKIISERSNQGIPVWAYGGSVILNGGEYYASNPSGDLIYTSKAGSSIIINGGKYIAALRDPSVPGTLNKRCALNSLDAVRDKVNIEVRGGEWLDFNPADNASEGPNTNFVPEGYVSETKDNVWWRVRKAIVTPEVPSVPEIPSEPEVEVPEDNSVYLTWENGNEMLEDTLGKNIIIK